MIRIIDLDNCISDDLWRWRHVAWQHDDPDRRFFHYHSLAPFDALENAQLVSTSHDLVVLTARPVMFKAATVEWLARNSIRPREIVMRNPADHTPSPVLKVRQLGWLFDLYGIRKSDIECAYDDRLDVVEAYRAAGIAAQVVAIHENEHEAHHA